ncbi:accessory factor associated with RNA polymerase II [Coemansia guatemalensis]|uniref:Accessory factor associated with RNA polymerase II n=1 Tax=Coemansia guatemalensis TaxID=2761395 RepID=A0A9W8LU25_9FUNG|nr:accessory factor associated with RNA polymerase II [Coemansia guatemalensis]
MSTAAAAAADPLELLRQYSIEKKPIELVDAEGKPTKDLLQATTVRFGEDASFPRDAPTRYLRSNSEADHYLLSALLHFLDRRDQSFYEYMKATNTMGLQTVSFGDRIGLLDYLTGKTASIPSAGSSASAEKHAAASSDAGQTRSRAATHASSTNAAAASTSKSADGALGADSAADIARSIARRERCLLNTSTALSSNKSFSHVSGLVKELFPSKPVPKGTGPAAASASAAGLPSTPGDRHKLSRRKRRDPTIVVPAATTAMLNMYNIKALLQDHEFVESRAVMEKGGLKPREIFVEHVMPNTGQNLRFRVVDSVQDFGEADWNSLVCVFTQGAAWQFKNWLWKSPAEVFQHCLGLYPKHQDEPLKEAIRSWGILPLNIERSKRHMDRATVAGLWSTIEEYIARHKPEFFQ